MQKFPPVTSGQIDVKQLKLRVSLSSRRMPWWEARTRQQEQRGGHSPRDTQLVFCGWEAGENLQGRPWWAEEDCWTGWKQLWGSRTSHPWCASVVCGLFRAKGKFSSRLKSNFCLPPPLYPNYLEEFHLEALPIRDWERELLLTNVQGRANSC